MRISAGRFRGRVLEAPPGKDVRPASDMIRQALFNILGPRLAGAVVLDLFAGTGSLGLEALSRGASRAVFVEKDRRVAEVLRRNVAALAVADVAAILSFDLLARPARLRDAGGPFDVVFVAPPYALMPCVEPAAGVGSLLEALWTDGIVKAGSGLVVLQHDRRSAVAGVWTHGRIDDRRTYGKTTLTFLVGKES